jgi:hypothetical protein
MGIYPLPDIDEADPTRGGMNITVAGEAVFDTDSYLKAEWQKAKDRSAVSDLITIEVDGAQLQMLAFWVHSDDVKEPRKIHDRYMDDTYIAYKKKIINPYNGRHLNHDYVGNEHFNALYTEASRTAAKRMNITSAGFKLLGLWLGREPEQTWPDFGLPELAQMGGNIDRDRFWELSTRGAMFVVRVDQAVGLDIRKDKMRSRNNVRASVNDVVYAIRRAQVRWCIDNSPPWRLKPSRAAARPQPRPQSHTDCQPPTDPERTINAADAPGAAKRDRKQSARLDLEEAPGSRGRRASATANPRKKSKPSGASSTSLAVQSQELPNYSLLADKMNHMNEQFHGNAPIEQLCKEWQETWSIWKSWLNELNARHIEDVD